MAELALARKCDKKEFASTLILVYFPDEEEVWMAHVGDGAIINIGENGKIEVLSYPHYGVLKKDVFYDTGRIEGGISDHRESVPKIWTVWQNRTI